MNRDEQIIEAARAVMKARMDVASVRNVLSRNREELQVAQTNLHFTSEREAALEQVLLDAEERLHRLVGPDDATGLGAPARDE